MPGQAEESLTKFHDESYFVVVYRLIYLKVLKPILKPIFSSPETPVPEAYIRL